MNDDQSIVRQRKEEKRGSGAELRREEKGEKKRKTQAADMMLLWRRVSADPVCPLTRLNTSYREDCEDRARDEGMSGDFLPKLEYVEYRFR